MATKTVKKNAGNPVVAEHSAMGGAFKCADILEGVFAGNKSTAPQEPATPEVAPVSKKDIDKSIPLEVDNERLIEAFTMDLNVIKAAGSSLTDSESSYKAKAIEGLAQILGIYRKYFEKTTPENSSMLKEELEDYCKVAKNKKRTVFHLLSRIYRGDNRKQSSADAKVLSLAVSANVEGRNFADWVKTNGGLDKIKKSVNEVQKLKEKTHPPRPKTVGQRKALFDRAEDAVRKVAKAKQVKEIFTMSEEAAPEMFGKLRPQDSGWRVLVVNVIDGDLCFHGLFDHQVDFRQNDNPGNTGDAS